MVELSTLNFSDGVSVNTDGEYRLLQLPDGLYLTGHGMLVPVDSADEGHQLICELNELRKNKEDVN